MTLTLIGRYLLETLNTYYMIFTEEQKLEQISFDKRADNYVERVNSHPDTWRGDVQTGYCSALSEQYELDKSIYLPYISYLQTLINRLGGSIDNEQVETIPYDGRLLNGKNFIQ